MEKLNSQPSIESRLEQLRKDEHELHKLNRELEQRMNENSGNHRLVEKLRQELTENHDILDHIDITCHNLEESITNPNPTIDGVFQYLHDTIHNLLQFLPQIFDYIRSIILDSSQEFFIPEGLMNKISHYPPELSKLVGILFNRKYKNDDYGEYEDDDDSGIFRKPDPVLEAKKKLKEKESEQRMNYILSLLEPIFFREGISPNYLSDINIFLTIVIMNCDKSGFILNSQKVSEDLISTFLSDSECEFPQNLLKLDFHIFFFKALRHPRIVKYLEENGMPERKYECFCNELPKYFLKLESFLGNVQADYIHMKHFQEIVEYLNKISNTFGL